MFLSVPRRRFDYTRGWNSTASPFLGLGAFAESERTTAGRYDFYK